MKQICIEDTAAGWNGKVQMKALKKLHIHVFEQFSAPMSFFARQKKYPSKVIYLECALKSVYCTLFLESFELKMPVLEMDKVRFSCFVWGLAILASRMLGAAFCLHCACMDCKCFPCSRDARLHCITEPLRLPIQSHSVRDCSPRKPDLCCQVRDRYSPDVQMCWFYDVVMITPSGN